MRNPPFAMSLFACPWWVPQSLHPPYFFASIATAFGTGGFPAIVIDRHHAAGVLLEGAMQRGGVGVVLGLEFLPLLDLPIGIGAGFPETHEAFVFVDDAWLRQRARIPQPRGSDPRTGDQPLAGRA